MTDKIYAPWTPEQVDALNRFQTGGHTRPFTCGRDHDIPVVLIARTDGWHCSIPECGYRQNWAPAIFAEPPSEWPARLAAAKKELREAEKRQRAEDAAREPDRQQEQAAPVDWQAIAEQREQERDGAYRERAHLLAWLAAIHPAVITLAPDVDEPGWKLLFINASGWQLSWHISPRDDDLFEHVERVTCDDPRAQWDGHTTEEKYERIRQLAALDGPGPEDTDTSRWLHVTFTNPDPYTANRSALAIRDWLPAEFPSIGMRIDTNAAEPEETGATPAERAPVTACGPACNEQHTYDWNCHLFAGIEGEPEPAPAASEATRTPDTITDPAYLRQQYAAVIRRWWDADDGGAEEIATALLAVRDRHLQQLQQRLTLADHELAQWAAAESADAAAGSYAMYAETVKQQRDQLAKLLTVILAEFRILPGTHTATAHVETETLDRWRATLDQTQEQP